MWLYLNNYRESWGGVSSAATFPGVGPCTSQRRAWPHPVGSCTGGARLPSEARLPSLPIEV